MWLLIILFIIIIILSFQFFTKEGSGKRHTDPMEGKMYKILNTFIFFGETENPKFETCDSYELNDDLEELKSDDFISKLIIDCPESVNYYWVLYAISNYERFIKTENVDLYNAFKKRLTFSCDLSPNKDYEETYYTIEINNCILTNMIDAKSNKDNSFYIDYVDIKDKFIYNYNQIKNYVITQQDEISLFINKNIDDDIYKDFCILLFNICNKGIPSHSNEILINKFYINLLKDNEQFFEKTDFKLKDIPFITVYSRVMYNIDCINITDNIVMFGETHNNDWNLEKNNLNVTNDYDFSNYTIKKYLEDLNNLNKEIYVYVEVNENDLYKKNPNFNSINLTIIIEAINKNTYENLKFIYADIRHSVLSFDQINEYFNKNKDYFLEIIFSENLFETTNMLDTFTTRKILSFQNKRLGMKKKNEYEEHLSRNKFLSRTAFEIKRLKDYNIDFYNIFYYAIVKNYPNSDFYKNHLLSSTYTDIYLIARLLRHPNKFNVFYHGSAHTEFLKSIFEQCFKISETTSLGDCLHIKKKNKKIRIDKFFEKKILFEYTKNYYNKVGLFNTSKVCNLF